MKLLILAVVCILAAVSIDSASAVCCFPWDITFHTEPESGSLIVSGELWNDSYSGEPFGKTDYRFRFADKNQETLFVRDILITEGHPIEGGFIIPPATVFPFQMVIDDIEPEIMRKIAYVSTDGTNSLEYFGWKPADLILKFDRIEEVKGNPQGEPFREWQITGKITNTNSDKTTNVYVLASLYGEEQNLVGVAGYSDFDIQPLTLDGHETREFTLYAKLPSQNIPVTVSLYAESDDSSMVHEFYMPVILKDRTDHTKRISNEYKQPIPIVANVTNISREDIDFDWIIQIKKSPMGVSQGDLTNYPESDIIEIHFIPSHIDAQKNIKMEFPWVPPTDGIYFYEEFIWKDLQPLSFPFRGTFLSDNWIMVDYRNYSLKSQLKSGVPFDKLECKEGTILVLRYDITHACVKPKSIEKLIERNWTTSKLLQEIAFENMRKTLGPECYESSMQDILNGMIDVRCKNHLKKLVDEHKSEMISLGYSLDPDRKVWIREGYPDMMMTILDFYLENQESETTHEPLESSPETILQNAKIIPNFPLSNPNEFQEVIQEQDSTCYTTPSMNKYCHKKPKIHDGQDKDHLSSIIIGDNGINGEVHFDKVGLEGGIFTIKNMELIDENKAFFTFADKDYRIGNKDSTTYEIIEEFEFDVVVEKYDSFITHCGNFDGSAATIVQYLGVENIDGADYFVTWHTVITSGDGFECKYPELIKKSLSHKFGDM